VKSVILQRSILVASLLLTASFTIQAQMIQVKEAYLLDSFGNTPNGDTKGRLDVLFWDLTENPGSKAVIFVHGDQKYVASRIHFHKQQVKVRRFESSRIKYVAGKNIGQRRNDFWVVPSGAKNPEPNPEAWIFSELGMAGQRLFQQQARNYLEQLWKSRIYQGYIINYGTRKQTAQREKWITSQMVSRRFDGPRITLVNGGAGAVRTVFWRVPPGAENP
jgi:hypothetical protein